MNPTSVITSILILLFIGINLTANNSVITFILKYFFFSNNTNKTVIRLLGVAILSTIVLILVGFQYYALLVNLLIAIIFTFLTIRGRNKAKQVAEQKRQEQYAMHKAQLEQRKKELARTRARKIKELEAIRNKPKSVKKIKEKLWDDGSMTNRELINNLTKK